MPVYLAMVRGVNVGAHQRIKMENLRASCESLEWRNAKTYIQSGNVVFRAGKESSSALAKKLESCVLRDFGFSLNVIVRTREEIGRIVKNNPLLKENGLDESKLHVAFLSETPPPAALKKLQELTLRPDRARASGREIYFYFPNGVSGSSLWKHPFERVLAVVMTMRNWKTVNQLFEMAVECE